MVTGSHFQIRCRCRFAFGQILLHRAEPVVIHVVLLTEYDEEKQRRLDREDGRAEGRAEAERRIIASMKESGMPPEEHCGVYGAPV